MKIAVEADGCEEATFTLSLRRRQLGPEMARYGWRLESVTRHGDRVLVTYTRRREA